MEGRIIKVTGGNIRNGHIYLREIIDIFPSESIGGSNKDRLAKQMLTVNYAGVGTIETDIDGDKKFFRDRKTVKQFFRHNSIQEGDSVVVTRRGKYEFEVNRA